MRILLTFSTNQEDYVNQISQLHLVSNLYVYNRQNSDRLNLVSSVLGVTIYIYLHAYAITASYFIISHYSETHP